MHRFKIVVAYEGTHYHGWQVQKGLPTVAQTLQDACARVFAEDIQVIGVSRTDAGVHARGQVATLVLQRLVSARTLKFAWNNALPDDITLVDCQSVALDYNPFAAIDHKIYHYHILTAHTLPFYVRYGWHIQRALEQEKLHDALQLFVGTHNFRSFSSGDERGDDTIRTIKSITVESLPAFHAYRIVIKGPAFLRYMIRRMVGAALDVTWDKKRSSRELAQALCNPNARQRFLNAPAHGLTLHKIVYTIDIQDYHDEHASFLV